MAIPTDKFLAIALRDAQAIQEQIKIKSTSLRDKSAIQPIKRSRVLGFYQDLKRARTALTEIRNVSGINAYAQIQFDNNTLDIVSIADGIIIQLDATILWVDTNFPQSGGFALVDTMDSDGTFSTAALDDFRTELTALITAVS